MELQFDKTVCPCLQKVVSKPQPQELTQELRLPDTMPDIGRILGCWGQILIRGKEWSSNAVSVSGGVMVWVLYAPEDGTKPASVDAWIPFQMRWDLPDTQHDGFIRVQPYIKAMDCRSLSARKMMIRSGITLMADAMEPVEAAVFVPGKVPEDVHLLTQTYPMELPQEGGGKAFQLEDAVDIPASGKIIHCQIQPRVNEQKVMAGKLVFRGTCSVHMLYASEEGDFSTLDFEMPFSQLADLDRDYSSNAFAQLHTVVTGLEPYTDPEGKMQFKCGLASQYVIFDRCMVEVVEDAYSNVRKVSPQCESLHLPVLLDTRREERKVSQIVGAQGQKIVEASVCWDYPVLRQSGDAVQAELFGQLQVLYYNEEGSLQGFAASKQDSWNMDSDPENQLQIELIPGDPSAHFGADGMEATMPLTLEASVFSRQGIPMVTALELGELQEPDPARPSLILRKPGDNTLWELAKDCGSTVEAIRNANHLQQEPSAEQMLLIPVL